jgi:surfeit locus 1 family protein
MMVKTDISRRRFRPTLWPTVFTVPAIALLVSFGFWQVQRLQWKEALIAEREASLTLAPISIETIPRTGPVPKFRVVSATGVFLHDREIYMDAKTYRGHSGGHVVTPLRLERGGVVFINRGWVPRQLRNPEKRAAGQVAGTVTVTGILRRSGAKSDWTPANQPERDTWYSVDVAQMGKRLGLTGIRRFYIEAGPAANPGGWPIGGQTLIKLSNNHLQYAFTWFSFAVVLLVIYVIYHFRRPEDGEETDGDDVGLS